MMEESIKFEDYIEKKPEKRLGIFKKKERNIQKPKKEEKELSELEKLEREIEEKKKLLELRQAQEKLKKNEELLRKAKLEKENLGVSSTTDNFFYHEGENSHSSLSPSDIEVPLSSEDLRKLKRCPKCNKKLFKNKVKQTGYSLFQVLKCKSPTCDFYKELRYNIK